MVVKFEVFKLFKTIACQPNLSTSIDKFVSKICKDFDVALIDLVDPFILQNQNTKQTTMSQRKDDWRKNPLQNVLKEDIETGGIPEEMTANDAQQTRPEYVAMGSKFAAHLSGMRRSLKGKKKKEDQLKLSGGAWNEKNPIWQQMKEDIISQFIPDYMTADEAQELREDYMHMSTDKFKS